MRVNPRLLQLNSQKPISLTKKPFHSLKQKKVFHSLATKSGRKLFETKIGEYFAKQFKLSVYTKDLIEKALNNDLLSPQEIKDIVVLQQRLVTSREISGLLRGKTDRYSPFRFLTVFIYETLAGVLSIPQNSLKLKSLLEATNVSIVLENSKVIKDKNFQSIFIEPSSTSDFQNATHSRRGLTLQSLQKIVSPILSSKVFPEPHVATFLWELFQSSINKNSYKRSLTWKDVSGYKPFETASRFYWHFHVLQRDRGTNKGYSFALGARSPNELDILQQNLNLNLQVFREPYITCLINSASQVCFESYCQILTDKLINLGYLQEPGKEFRNKNKLNPSGHARTLVDMIEIAKQNEIILSTLSLELKKVEKILKLLVDNRPMNSHDFIGDTVSLHIPNELIKLLSKLAYIPQQDVNPENIKKIKNSLLDFENYQEDLCTVKMNLMLRDAGLAFCNYLISSLDSSLAEELKVETADCPDKINQFRPADILYPDAQIASIGFINLLIENWGAKPVKKTADSTSPKDLKRSKRDTQNNGGQVLLNRDGVSPEGIAQKTEKFDPLKILRIYGCVDQRFIQATSDAIRTILDSRITLSSNKDVQLFLTQIKSNRAYDEVLRLMIRHNLDILLKDADEVIAEKEAKSQLSGEDIKLFYSWEQSSEWTRSKEYKELVDKNLDPNLITQRAKARWIATYSDSFRNWKIYSGWKQREEELIQKGIPLHVIEDEALYQWGHQWLKPFTEWKTGEWSKRPSAKELKTLRVSEEVITKIALLEWSKAYNLPELERKGFNQIVITKARETKQRIEKTIEEARIYKAIKTLKDSSIRYSIPVAIETNSEGGITIKLTVKQTNEDKLTKLKVILTSSSSHIEDEKPNYRDYLQLYSNKLLTLIYNPIEKAYEYLTNEALPY